MKESAANRRMAKDRSLAPLPALTLEANLDNWIKAVKFTAKRVKLSKYITADVEAPEEDTEEYE